MNERTANLGGSYETEEEALHAVADSIRAYGSSAAAKNLALHRTTENRPDEVVARGDKLARLALDRFPITQRRSA